jgi:hypothetical protein
MSLVFARGPGRETDGWGLAYVRAVVVGREDWSATSDTVSMTAAAFPIRSVCAAVRLSTVSS